MDHLCYLCLVFVMLSRLVVPFWVRVGLLAFVCDVKLCFCHYSMWYPGSGVVLDCIYS